MGGFVTNCWYMAAWSHEIETGPLARRLLDIPMVLFRGGRGVVAALHDRCPHRFAPLSRGRVDGDSIRCGYHGLCFDRTGDCTDSPFGIAVPPGIGVRSFSVEERHGCIWIWPGDGEPDPSMIPDFGYHEDAAFRVVRGVSNIKAHFELVTDNLMDLTHTRYLHPGFGGDNWVPTVRFSQDNETLFAHYELPETPPSEFSEAFFPAHGKPVRERDVMRWNLPSTMYLFIEMGIAGAPDDAWVPQPSSHILCPETENSCHYFWASGALADAPISDADHFEAVKWAFDTEDAPMLEAAHGAMEGADFWELRPAILEYDSAAIRARRIVRKHLRHERGEAPVDA
jgi:phenylpropionate dioxygenase-like ring-hydroxylating dioxygenase large terminal subunit